MGNEQGGVSDVQLVEAAVDGQGAEVRGFDAFIREQYRSLVQFLRGRTVTEQDAEDAAQESLAKLLRYRESEPASAWKQLLYRIAVNVAHDQFRLGLRQHRKAHVALGALDGQEMAATEQTPEERAVYEQQVARLTEAILQLPPKCQHVYLLKQVHGLSRAQIAERCGISVKMVEKHLASAIISLQRKVGHSSAGTF